MKSMTHFRLLMFPLAAAVFFCASPVLADAIDGSWCNGVKRLEIDGAKIVTPGGKSIEGIYGRHDFTYTVPAGEPGAGKNVDMDLIGDDDLRVWPKGRSPAPQNAGAQMWKRCAAPVS